MRKLFDVKFIVALGAQLAVGLLMVKFAPPDSLDAKFYYTGDQARALLAGFSEMDLRSYLVTELLDGLFILAYTSTLLLGLTRLYGKGPVVVALTLAPGLFDVIETSGVLYALNVSFEQGYFDWLGIVTCSKWSFAGLAVLAFFFGLSQKKTNL